MVCPPGRRGGPAAGPCSGGGPVGRAAADPVHPRGNRRRVPEDSGPERGQRSPAKGNPRPAAAPPSEGILTRMALPADVVAQVRRRANFACEYCGASEADTAGELTVDHYRPRTRGGTDDLGNLLYCCYRC